MCILAGRQSLLLLSIYYTLPSLLAVGIASIIFVQFYKKTRREKSSPYAKLDEKGYERLLMTTKDSDGCKYKKLEDGEGDDSSDSTTTDEHKKMLN